MKTNNQQIAETILEQLGGNRMMAMTGAHVFVAIENGLQFRLRGGAKQRINSVRIVLTPADTYTVTFLRINKADALRGEAVIVATVDDVYCDSLQDVFEHHTGLFTTLMARS